MKTPLVSSDARSRRRLIALVTVLVAIVVLAGVGVYGLLTGPPASDRDPDHDGGTRPGPAVTTPGDPAPTGTPSLPDLPEVEASDDPETFARNVAEALFAWDSASGLMPLDYTSVVLAVGDPSGAEQAGLASDVAAYLPSRDAWLELRQYATAQHLTIEHAYVPEAWDTAVEQAQPGQLAEGTIAYTIEGTRHRTGVWNDEQVTSEHAVAFTVFIVCAPTYDTCHLLRLSQLDNPSDSRLGVSVRVEEGRGRRTDPGALRTRLGVAVGRGADEPRRHSHLCRRRRSHGRRCSRRAGGHHRQR
ncbi:MAG TPA: hypothetical protein PKE42_00125 [Arachnia sp.]|nr:hypothetical protein [Arachnia sp.]